MMQLDDYLHNLTCPLQPTMKALVLPSAAKPLKLEEFKAMFSVCNKSSGVCLDIVVFDHLLCTREADNPTTKLDVPVCAFTHASE
jgi:hypothetical protein